MRRVWAAAALGFACAVAPIATAGLGQWSGPSARAAEQSAAATGYRLGAGDKLRVITFGEQSLTGDFQVGSTGKIALPLIGEIQAAGLTTPEFQREVEATLRAGYMKEPRVSVEVLNYRPFYILGEVARPGEYPYTNGLTVLNAVATANGFTYRANKRRVFIKRADGVKEEAYPLTSNTQVAPGDTVRIGERFF